VVGSGLALGDVRRRTLKHLFIILKQNVGLANFMSDSHMFVQKRERYMT